MHKHTFLMMAGGTGGHVFPALATAKLLQKEGHHIVWMGSKGGMEEGVMASEDIEFHGLTVSGLRGKGIARKLLAPIKLMKALWEAIVVIRKVKPDCAVGMGGFASGPGGAAIKLLGKPLVVHEQNAIAGMTNQFLAKVANAVLEAFPDSFPGRKADRLTGNPIRSDITKLFYRPDTEAVISTPLKVLVLGGSLGAEAINQCLPKALAKLDEASRPKVWHQTGKNKLESTRESYRKEGLEDPVTIRVDDFIADMGEAYRWADIAVCRAGALTISELCCAGVGAILVPYPHAVDDHQTKNARSMEQGGAAWCVAQEELTPDALAQMLKSLSAKPSRVERLQSAALKLAKPDATEQVAEVCRRLCYV